MGAEGAPVCLWSRIPQGTHQVPIRSLYRGDLQGPTQLGGGCVRVCWALGWGGGKQKGPYLLESSSFEWVAGTLCKRKKLVLGCSPQGLPEGRSQVFSQQRCTTGKSEGPDRTRPPLQEICSGVQPWGDRPGRVYSPGEAWVGQVSGRVSCGRGGRGGRPRPAGDSKRFFHPGELPKLPFSPGSSGCGYRPLPSWAACPGETAWGGSHPTWASVPASQRRDTALPCPSPSSPAALPAGGWQPRRAEPEHPSPLTAPLNLPQPWGLWGPGL